MLIPNSLKKSIILEKIEEERKLIRSKVDELYYSRDECTVRSFEKPV